MSAILTDQFRVIRASDFVASIGSTANTYYAFLGMPYTDEYQLDWSLNIPDPVDSFEQEYSYSGNMISLSKINPSDVRQIIPKYQWISGQSYEMYRHDYSRNNLSPFTRSTRLYDSRYYVVNKDYNVYICLQNGTDPENPNGRPSINEPTHTTPTPQIAGDGSDRYIWKFLYRISPLDIIKFDSTDFIPVPPDWQNNPDVREVRESSANGSIEIVTIKNAGFGYGSANTYNNIPILGDGDNGRVSISVAADGKISNIVVTNRGSNYTFGTIDISEYIPHTGIGTTTLAEFDVIIPPKGGHGKNIYRELGATRVLLYTRFENVLTENPDLIASNSFARLGIVREPKVYGSNSNFTEKTGSALYAIKLTGVGASTASFIDDELVTQTIGIGSTAVGRVASYDNTTQVLKVWQDKNLNLSQPKGGPLSPAYGIVPRYGYKKQIFSGNIGVGASALISQPDNPSPLGLSIDTAFNGNTTIINSRTYKLGQNFVNGVAAPEIEPNSGDIVYIDNRDTIPRSQSQKEDVKIILEF